MQREPKHLLDPLLKDLNQDQVILLRPLQWNGRPGEQLKILAQTMNISNQQTSGTIRWQADQASGELPAPGGTISLTLNKPGVITLHAQWLAEDGSPLAKNQVNLVCAATPSTSARLCVVDDLALAQILRDLGYSVSEGQPAPDTIVEEIVVATQYTDTVKTTVQQGGRVLLLAADVPENSSSIPLPVGQLITRAGTAWQGDWANSFAWVKKQGPLAHLPGDPLLEMEWAAIMPDAVIDGLPQWVLRDHSWAGLAVGWVHKAVSLLAHLPYGRGQMLITTFKLNADTLTRDAVAQALFAGLVNIL
jgi:hypothetical protein